MTRHKTKEIHDEAKKFDKWLREYQAIQENTRKHYMHQINRFFNIREGKKVKGKWIEEKEGKLLFTNFFQQNKEIQKNYIKKFLLHTDRCYIRRYALQYWLESLGLDNVLKELNKSFHSYKLKAREHVTKSLTKEQLNVVIKAVSKNQKLKTILMIAYDTALRITSILQLQKENFLYDKEDNLYYLRTVIKGGKIVTKYIENQTANNIKALSIKKGCPLFTKIIKKGGKDKVVQLQYLDIYYELKNITRKALGLGYGISFHWFRHSRAIDLLRKYDIMTVKDMLDHSSVAITEGYVSETGIESKKIIKKEDKWKGV